MANGLYRCKQLWWAVKARPLSSADWAIISPYLTTAERALFDQFSPNDQQHSLRVFTHLYQAGHDHSDLLKAALLHDIGKTAVNLTLLDRCMVVIGSVLVPHRSSQWGGKEKNWMPNKATGWRKPFVVKHHHAAWGANMAQSAGSSPFTCSLIRYHQDIIPEDTQNNQMILIQLHQLSDNQS